MANDFSKIGLQKQPSSGVNDFSKIGMSRPGEEQQVGNDFSKIGMEKQTPDEPAVADTSFFEKIKQGAAGGIQSNVIQKTKAYAKMNQWKALQEAISTAEKRGWKAGLGPFNRPIEQLKAEADALFPQAQEDVNLYENIGKEIGADVQGTSTGSKVADLAGEIIGGLGSAPLDPTNLVFPAGGVSKSLLGTMARGAGANVAVAAPMSLAGQHENVMEGKQEKIDWASVAKDTVIAALLGGGLHGATTGKQRADLRGVPDASQTPVLQKAAAIAKAEGRTTITAADIRAAESGAEPKRDLGQQADAFPNDIDDSRVVSPYNQVEANTAMQRDLDPQGDMFDNRQIYTPDEVQQRQLLGEGGVSAKNRPETIGQDGLPQAIADPLGTTMNREAAPSMGTQPGEPTRNGAMLPLEDRATPAQTNLPWDVAAGEVPRVAPRVDPVSGKPIDLGTGEHVAGERIPYTEDIARPAVGDSFTVDRIAGAPIGKEFVVKKGNDHYGYFGTLEQAAADAERRNTSALNRKNEFDPALTQYTNKGDFKGALGHIADNSENKGIGVVAAALAKDSKYNPKLTIVGKITSEMAGVAIKAGEVIRGLTSNLKGIYLENKFASHMHEITIVHEGVHFKVAALQYMREKGHEFAPHVNEALDNINDLYKHVKEVASPELLEKYGMRDQYEFIAEAFANPNFQQVLRDIRVNGESKYGGVGRAFESAKNAWEALVLSIGRAIGLKVKDYNALSLTLNEGSKLMRYIDEDGGLAKQAYSKEAMAHLMVDSEPEPSMPKKVPVGSKPATLSQFKKSLVAEGSNAAFVKQWGDVLYKEHLKEWEHNNKSIEVAGTEDLRDFDTFAQEALYTADGEKRTGDLTAVRRVALHLSHLAGAKRLHQIIRRTGDGLEFVKNLGEQLHNHVWHESALDSKYKAFGVGLAISNVGRTLRKENPASVARLAKKLSNADKESVMKLVQEVNGKPITVDDAFLKSRLTPEGTAFYKKLREVYDKLEKVYNETRVKEGLAAANVLPNYFTNVRHGDWQLYVKDATGQTVKMYGFDSMRDAHKVAEHLKNTMGKGFDTYVGAKYRNDNVSLLPIEGLVQAKKFAENATQAAAIDAALANAIQRLGVRKYAMERKGVAGAVGSDEVINTLGVDKAWQQFMNSHEFYSKSISRYAGNAPMKEFMKKLNGSKATEDFKNAVNWANYFYNSYMGEKTGAEKALSRWTQDFMMENKVFAAFTQLPGVNKMNVHALNNAFITTQLMMYNAQFVVANTLQPMLAIPKMAQLNTEALGGKGNISEAVVKGMWTVFWPSEKNKDVLREAQKRGASEASFAEALDWDSSGVMQYVTGKKLAASVDVFTRGMTYSAMYEFAKSAGHSSDKAHSFATKNTNDVMVNYDRYARMPILNKMGVVGNLFSPLTTFMSNYAGHAISYAASAKKGDVMPAFLFLGMTGLMAGLRGMPLTEDYDRFALMYNKYASEEGMPLLPTIKEALVKAGLPEAVEYGVPSAVLGVNMSGSAGGGTVVGSLGTTAGASYGVDLAQAGMLTIKEVFNKGLEAIHRFNTGGNVQEVADAFWSYTTLSDKQKMEMVLPLAPKGLRAMIQNYYTNRSGGGTDSLVDDFTKAPTNPLYGTRDSGTIVRTPESNLKAMAGFTPMEENQQQEKQFMSTTAKATEGNEKKYALTKLADVAEGRATSSDAFDEVLRIMTQHPDWDFPDALLQKLYDRVTSYEQKAALKDGNIASKQRALEGRQ